MKKAIIKTSVLIGVSSLLVACGSSSGGGSNANPENNAEPINQPVASKPQATPEGHQSNDVQQPPKAQEENNEPKTETVQKDKIERERERQEEPNSVSEEGYSLPSILTPDVILEQSKSWEVKCVSSSTDYCNTSSDIQNTTVAIYKLTTEESRLDSKDKTTEVKEQDIILTSDDYKKKEFSGTEYKFQLLDNINSYYGYRQRALNDHSGSYYQYIYAFNPDYENQSALDTNYSAKYTGEFLYSPYSGSDKATNNITKSGNVDITYTDGKVVGTVKDRDSNVYGYTLFNISGDQKSLIIESTPNTGNTISPNQKTSLDVKFINSNKNANDRKYILGTAVASPSSGNNQNYVGFSGVLYAEKQNSN